MTVRGSLVTVTVRSGYTRSTLTFPWTGRPACDASEFGRPSIGGDAVESSPVMVINADSALGKSVWISTDAVATGTVAHAAEDDQIPTT